MGNEWFKKDCEKFHYMSKVTFTHKEERKKERKKARTMV
jgi:hypothetical protein